MSVQIFAVNYNSYLTSQLIVISQVNDVMLQSVLAPLLFFCTKLVLFFDTLCVMVVSSYELRTLAFFPMYFSIVLFFSHKNFFYSFSYTYVLYRVCAKSF